MTCFVCLRSELFATFASRNVIPEYLKLLFLTNLLGKEVQTQTLLSNLFFKSEMSNTKNGFGLLRSKSIIFVKLAKLKLSISKKSVWASNESKEDYLVQLLCSCRLLSLSSLCLSHCPLCVTQLRSLPSLFLPEADEDIKIGLDRPGRPLLERKIEKDQAETS